MICGYIVILNTSDLTTLTPRHCHVMEAGDDQRRQGNKKRRWSAAKQASRSLFAGCLAQEKEERVGREFKLSEEGIMKILRGLLYL